VLVQVKANFTSKKLALKKCSFVYVRLVVLSAILSFSQLLVNKKIISASVLI